MLKIISNSSTLYYIKVILLGLFIALTAQIAYAWVSPTQIPPNGNIGLRQYVSDCNQFTVNGWSSKQECLTDGRWHVVQSTSGIANADLKNAVNAGADIRIGHNISGAGNATIANCQQAMIISNLAFCNEAIHYSGSVLNGNPNSTTYGFNATNPLPHPTWGAFGSVIYRSDRRYKMSLLVPSIPGSVSEARVSQANGIAPAASPFKWYVRY